MRYRIYLSITLIFLISFSAKSQKLPDIQLKDLKNNYVSIQELKGEKLTLVDFWASWCKPCLKSIPALNNIYEDYKDKGLTIIGVNNDGPRSVSKVKPLVKSLNITYPVLMDLNAELMKDLNLSAFPSLVLFNKKGKIVWMHEGFVTGDEELIKQKIEKYLAL